MNAQLKEIEAPFRELLIGCGSSIRKQIRKANDPEAFVNVTTLDIEPRHNPDVVHDLNILPWPFDDNTFDEVHAHEVLEHLGKQGDYKAFFAHFSEIWRVLKPDGLLYASVPMWDSPWAWADPGHTRIIAKHSLIFLNQDEYSQVGKTSITDYRGCYSADLVTIALEESENTLSFILQARK